MSDVMWLLALALVPTGFGAGLWLFFRRIRDRRSRRPALRLLAGNLLVLMFLASTGFLAGEMYYRWFYDSSDAFNYTKISKRWYERHFHVNAQGARDDLNYQSRIMPGLRRITFLGDSFTVGHGIKDVGDRFANCIRRANPEWEVQVLAFHGAETGGEFEMIKRVVNLGCELDQVVLIYCLNDLSDLVPEWNAIVERIYLHSESPPWLVSRSYFANTMYYRLKSRRDPDMANYYQFLVPAYRGQPWEAQKPRLRALRELVESHGGHFLVVTFPFLHAPLDESYAYHFAHRQLDKFWRELGVPHLDLLPVFQGLPPKKLIVNRFDPHPNELANRLAADAIEKFLKSNMSAPPKPVPFNPSGP